MMYDHDPNSINVLIEEGINAFILVLLTLDQSDPIGLMDKSRCEALIRLLVQEKHYDINALRPGNVTALECVAINNCPIATKFLIDLGANVDAHILEVAAFSGAHNVLHLLKESFPDLCSIEKLLNLSISGFADQDVEYLPEHIQTITFLVDELRCVEGDFQALLDKATEMMGAYSVREAAAY